jgi:hypothetical protein
MADNFQPGALTPVQFQPVGGQLVTLNVTGQTLEFVRQLFDVTHTGHQGRGTARIAGKGDCSGNLTMDYDADRSPVSLNLLDGISGLLLFFVTPTRPIQVPAIVEKTNYRSTVSSQVSFNVDVKQNILVGNVVYGTT